MANTKNTPNKASVLDFTDLKCGENDNIRLKEIVRRILTEDQDILSVLQNLEIEKQCESLGYLDGELYFYKNILPFYTLNNSIVDKQNYICYTTGFSEIPRYNKTDKYGLLTFYILCDVETINYEGMPRHDVLAQLISNIFNWSHVYDTQMVLVDDAENTVDTRYVTRILTFQFTKPNGIIQSNKHGQEIINRVVNKTKGLERK